MEFNVGLIDALCDIVAAIKPQLAFYEALGPEGALVLKLTLDYAKAKGMYVICDGKRNDIGSTAKAYSAAYLGTVIVGKTELFAFDADALTVNPYLGSDGIKPFIEAAEKNDKAIFALVKTSNQSAGELQDLVAFTKKEADSTDKPATDLPVYAIIGDLMESISLHTTGRHGFTRVGAVVGATYPEEIEYLRNRLKNTFFLVPGYGAQGGSASDVARAFNEDGHGAVVNASRSIITAWKTTGLDYGKAARDEALRMRDELRKALYR